MYIDRYRPLGYYYFNMFIFIHEKKEEIYKNLMMSCAFFFSFSFLFLVQFNDNINYIDKKKIWLGLILFYVFSFC